MVELSSIHIYKEGKHTIGVARSVLGHVTLCGGGDGLGGVGGLGVVAVGVRVRPCLALAAHTGKKESGGGK